MKVYDCFTFYNEFELLELRLKSLWYMVDYFVLVEADKTQNNVPKPFHFAEHEKDFKEFLPKIRHIPLRVNVEYKGVGDWQIEHGQRNGIMYGLSDAAPDDLIFISDVDEIPEPDILNRISKNKVQLISQCPIPPPVPAERYLYRVNYLFRRRLYWNIRRLSWSKLFTTIIWIGYLKENGSAQR